jgi:hypothetical protein
MIPMRTSTVFKNRWMALLWAAGIIWFALDYAGSSDSSAAAPAKKAETKNQTDTHLKDASGRPISAEDLRQLSGAAN